MSDERLGKPSEDDDDIQSIEVSFAVGVFVRPLDYQMLDLLLDRIVNRDCNQFAGGCHWLAGQGSKPTFSQMDSRFLGKPVDPQAPVSGEPTYDSSTFFVESAARPYHDEDEKTKSRQTKAKYARGRIEHQIETLRRYLSDLERELAALPPKP